MLERRFYRGYLQNFGSKRAATIVGEDRADIGCPQVCSSRTERDAECEQKIPVISREMSRRPPRDSPASCQLRKVMKDSVPLPLERHLRKMGTSGIALSVDTQGSRLLVQPRSVHDDCHRLVTLQGDQPVVELSYSTAAPALAPAAGSLSLPTCVGRCCTRWRSFVLVTVAL
jgi:hypothetical protein